METPVGIEHTPKRDLRIMVQKTLPKLQQVVAESGIDPEEGALNLDPNYPYITSHRFQNGQKFAFWAGLETSWVGHPNHPDPTGLTATINNLKVDENLRGRGIGTRIVSTWEQALSEQGVQAFVANKISSNEAVEFWTKQGYVIPEEEAGKPIPYWMYKNIPKAA